MELERLSQKRAPIGGFLTGVLLSQIANNALHLAQPLLMVELSGSLGKAALFSSFDTAVHMLGTFAGGWPADRFGARRLLILSTAGRGLALALIPAAMLLGRLTPMIAALAYTLDALVRGFVDTAAHAAPLNLAGHDQSELDRINSRYEFTFDLGAVAGPILLGASMIWLKGSVAHLMIPAGFLIGAAAFMAMPSGHEEPRSDDNTGQGGTLDGLRAAFADGRLLLGCAGIALLNLYPLRKLLSAFFAKSILLQPAAAGWVGAAFGIGGAAGSLVYSWRPGRERGGWVTLGAAGALILAAGWVPANLMLMIAAAAVFSFTNVGARLSITRSIQQATPERLAGGVAAVSRFASNAVSVILKALVAAAFSLGLGARGSFAVVAAGLVTVALCQLRLAVALLQAKKDSELDPLAEEERSASVVLV